MMLLGCRQSSPIRLPEVFFETGGLYSRGLRQSAIRMDSQNRLIGGRMVGVAAALLLGTFAFLINASKSETNLGLERAAVYIGTTPLPVIVMNASCVVLAPGQLTPAKSVSTG
jgi:hypothetical protein